MTRERVGVQHTRDLRGQSIEPVAHADRATRQIDLGASGNLDHVPAAFNAANTRRSARSLTKGSRRSRVPSTNSISITPTVRPSPDTAQQYPAMAASRAAAAKFPRFTAGP